MPTGGAPAPASTTLLWLPLGAGAGGRFVRANGRVFEAAVARWERRVPLDLYHSALEVRLGQDRWALEMAPVWSHDAPDRGVVGEGPVGARPLGRSRWFRYEVRCWRGGVVPDAAAAVDSPRELSTDADRARRVLELAGSFPLATWGRDEQRTGDMWNSNSLVSWLLVRSGHDTDSLRPPAHGRAPGWSAGLVVAARQAPSRPQS